MLGTRFEHSLGVAHLAARMMDSVLDTSKYTRGSRVVADFFDACRRDLRLFIGRRRRTDHEVIADVRKILRTAALCHDIGHFPLSHTTERAFQQEFWNAVIPAYIPPKACHEVVSAEIVRHILETGDSCLEGWVARAVVLTLLAPSSLTVRYAQRDLHFRETIFSTLNGILAGDYDADRLDYLQRDGYLSGSGFGKFDVERFIDAMTLVEHHGSYVVMPSTRAISTIEAALIERYKLYKWVYFHHKALFFDEVCCELGRRLLKSSPRLLRPYAGTVHSPVNYCRSVMRSLESPNRHIPPLILFRGREICRSRPYYVLNPDFFVRNSQSHFFDDVWFCQHCRQTQDLGSAGQFYLEALVERQACGITLWKDWSQFEVFCDCLREASQSRLFADTVGGGSYQLHVPRFLDNLWGLMRKGEFPDPITQQLVAGGTRRLRAESFRRVRPVVRIADWSLFGNIEMKQIVGRTGRPDHLSKHSTVLKDLSGLKGEIPFYIFLAGEAADIDTLRSSQKNLRHVLTIMAQAFIEAVVQYFDVPEIIREAWNRAGSS
jgi:hypothetical protein